MNSGKFNFIIHMADTYKTEHKALSALAEESLEPIPVKSETKFRCEHHLHQSGDCHEQCPYRYIDTYDQIMGYLCKKYGAPIGSGRHRITFESKNVVIKMPKNIGALWASQTEYDRFKRQHPSERDRLARCRLITLFNVPVIVMEKLNTNIDYTTKPNWSWDYDCGQVGMDRKGNWKAFDYTTV